MNGYRWLRLPVLAALVFLVSGAASAQAAVSELAGLNFGSFVAGNGGTVQVNYSGYRSKTGGVMLVPQGPGSAGRFQVTNAISGLNYSITFPVSAVLSNGTSTMTVTNFLSSANPILINSGGTQTFSVGATLTAASAQPRGTYSGTYTVTVQYP